MKATDPDSEDAIRSVEKKTKNMKKPIGRVEEKESTIREQWIGGFRGKEMIQ